MSAFKRLFLFILPSSNDCAPLNVFEYLKMANLEPSNRNLRVDPDAKQFLPGLIDLAEEVKEMDDKHAETVRSVNSFKIRLD